MATLTRHKTKKLVRVLPRVKIAAKRLANKVTKRQPNQYNEDRSDIAAARKALANPQRTPYETVRKDLGLS